MRSPKTIKAAVDKGAFMVYADDWRGINRLNPDSISRALYLAVVDSWSDESDDIIGNGFLSVPRNRIREIATTENGETAAIYTTLIKSNISARKKYINGNPLLAGALEEMDASKSEDKGIAAK